MGSASLPIEEASGLSEAELQQFLQQYGLTPCEGEASLHLRASKLKQAIESNPMLIDPARTADEKRAAY